MEKSSRKRKLQHSVDSTSNQEKIDFVSSPFSVYDYCNMNLDKSMKRTVLDVAPSVVSIVTHTGKEIFFGGSGIIMRCDQIEGGLYRGTIISLATLVVNPDTNQVLDNIVVDVYLCGGISSRGQIITTDMDLNLLFISIMFETPLAVAKMAWLEDSLDISPNGSSNAASFELDPQTRSNICDIQPDDILIVVGRYCKAPYQLMAAGGQFRTYPCKLDCNELFRMTSVITKCGIGGPVIGKHGEVMGIAFCASGYTPFLPINVALLWWEHYEQNKGSCRLLGIKVASLYAEIMETMDVLAEEFPHVSKGAIVKKVKRGSSADKAGICAGDVIIECSGSLVRSSLHLYELAWGSAGESLNLVIIRPGESVCLNLTVSLSERGPSDINRWPVLEGTMS